MLTAKQGDNGFIIVCLSVRVSDYFSALSLSLPKEMHTSKKGAINQELFGKNVHTL